jgi:hypothetical protein
MEDNPKTLATYQRGTLLVGAVAFLGSYIYMLARLLDRINNHDLYPISFYYFSVRFITSVLMAMVMRHVLDFFFEMAGNRQNQLLLLLGFAIGFAPDLFLIAMLRKAFQVMKISGSQNEPAQSDVPTSLRLLMLEGMSRDKIDRLTELGIDNAQVLANQNPFVLWPRLPYSLLLIVDWISEAQLYRFAKERRMVALRNLGINNIFDLDIILKDDGASASVAAAIDLPAQGIAAYRATFANDPAFRNLQEVRNLL